MEKICSIKLVTGEELVCSVIEIMEFDSHTSVAIHNPLKITHRSSSRKTDSDILFKFSEEVSLISDTYINFSYYKCGAGEKGCLYDADCKSGYYCK